MPAGCCSGAHHKKNVCDTCATTADDFCSSSLLHLYLPCFRFSALAFPCSLFLLSPYLNLHLSFLNIWITAQAAATPALRPAGSARTMDCKGTEEKFTLFGEIIVNNDACRPTKVNRASTLKTYCHTQSKLVSCPVCTSFGGAGIRRRGGGWREKNVISSSSSWCERA